MDDNKPTAIDVNLKLPDNSQDEFKLGDMIRFLWAGRKTLLVCTLIGLVLGIVVTGVYYVSKRPVVSGGIVNATMKYMYPEAASKQAPDATPLDHAVLLSERILEPAMDVLGDIDFNIDDLRSGLSYEDTEDATLLNLSLSLDNEDIEKNIDGIAVLNALIESYQLWFNETYGVEPELQLATERWDSYFISNTELNNMEYNEGIVEITQRLNELLLYLDELCSVEPVQTTDGGISFFDLRNDVYVVLNDLGSLEEKLLHKPYVKNVSLFQEGVNERLEELEQERMYLLRLLEQYTAAASSMGSVNIISQPQAGGSLSVFDVLMNDIFACENEIAAINSSLALINSGDNTEGNTVVGDAIDEVIYKLLDMQKIGQTLYKKQQESLLGIQNSSYDEFFIVMTSPSYQTLSTAGASTLNLLIIFLGLTFVGFVLGLLIITSKKYLLVALV